MSDVLEATPTTVDRDDMSDVLEATPTTVDRDDMSDVLEATPTTVDRDALGQTLAELGCLRRATGRHGSRPYCAHQL